VQGLPEGTRVVIEGREASHGHEARGLPAGTHTVWLYGPEDQEPTQPKYKPVMVADDERVVLSAGLAELDRGPVPTRSPTVPKAEPQWLHIALADRRTTRAYVGNEPVAFELSTGTWDVELAPGSHQLLVTVGGRRRHTQAIDIAGAPWRCGVDAFGHTTCVELMADLADAPPADVQGLLARIDVTSPDRRLALLDEVEGKLSCAQVAEVMGRFVGDDERLVVAEVLRPHVIDPGAYRQLLQKVTFAPTEQAITALYEVR